MRESTTLPQNLEVAQNHVPEYFKNEKSLYIVCSLLYFKLHSFVLKLERVIRDLPSLKKWHIQPTDSFGSAECNIMCFLFTLNTFLYCRRYFYHLYAYIDCARTVYVQLKKITYSSVISFKFGCIYRHIYINRICIHSLSLAVFVCHHWCRWDITF